MPKEIAELSRSERIGDRMVFVTCYPETRRPRYRIELRCGRRTAILDVPRASLDVVRGRIDEAVWAFAESLRLAESV